VKSTVIGGWFREHHGVMTTKELLDRGITYYSIRKLLSEGTIYKVKRGIYGIEELSENENALIGKLLPKGIYCLQSAAFIHDYSMDIPLRYHIAVHNKTNHNLPDYPLIKLHYWKGQQLNQK
jgi:predicted transcriptional regulator of viral defense system